MRLDSGPTVQAQERMCAFMTHGTHMVRFVQPGTPCGCNDMELVPELQKKSAIFIFVPPLNVCEVKPNPRITTWTHL